MKKWIKATISLFLYSGSVIGSGVLGVKTGKSLQNVNDDTQEKLKRLQGYNELMTELLLQGNRDDIVARELSERKITSVAIYGKGTLGKILLRQLVGSSIRVKCFIDKESKTELEFNGIPVFPLDKFNERENIDAIVITPICDFWDIKKELRGTGISNEILSLEDLVYTH